MVYVCISIGYLRVYTICKEGSKEGRISSKESCIEMRGEIYALGANKVVLMRINIETAMKDASNDEEGWSSAHCLQAYC